MRLTENETEMLVKLVQKTIEIPAIGPDSLYERVPGRDSQVSIDDYVVLLRLMDRKLISVERKKVRMENGAVMTTSQWIVQPTTEGYKYYQELEEGVLTNMNAELGEP